MSQVLILMSVFNGVLHLKEQIESIQAQSVQDWNLLIRDDGSHDDSLKIINEFTNIDKRIQLYTDTLGNLGVKESFHQLVIASQSMNAQYYAFADQDDVWDDDKLERTLNLLETQSPKSLQRLPILAYTDLKVVDKNLKLIDKSFWHYQRISPQKNTFNRLLLQNIVTGCTVIFNQKLREMLLDMPKGAVLHDWWAALIAGCFGRLLFLPHSTISYRQHGKNVIGEKAFNISNIVKDFQSKKYLASRTKAIHQALAFLQMYQSMLDARSKAALHVLIKWQSIGFIKRVYYMFKHGLLRQGTLRNFSLFFLG